jgi:hypothetical protein
MEAQGQDVTVVNNPLEHGVIQSGRRVGVWRYFDYPGQLGLEIDYETMQVNHLQVDSSLFVVKEGDRWTRQRLKYPCRPHGSRMHILEAFYTSLHSEYELYRKADRKNEPVETVLTFEVGEEGVATKPKVWGYTGFGMEKMMLKAFDAAPNLWIPGIKLDGSVATCRFGAFIKVCPDTCTRMPPSDTVRMLYGVSNYGSRSKGPNPVSNERAGMSFSPDGQMVAFGARLMAETNGNGFLVVSTKDGSQQFLPYGTIRNLYWRDNQHLSFKYTYGLSGEVNGIYDVISQIAESWTDSITFFERLSPDLSMLYAGRIRNRFLEVVRIDGGKTEWLIRKPDSDLFPVSWSPNQQFAVIKGRKEKLDQLYLYTVSTGSLKQLPLMDAEPCGWSADESIVYVRKSNPFSFSKAEVFAVETKTNLFNSVTGKIDNFIAAEFSSKANMFLMLRNGNLFLFSPTPEAKHQKILSNVSYAVWNKQGTSIAYISEKGRLLSLYDVQSGRSRILLNRLTGK